MTIETWHVEGIKFSLRDLFGKEFTEEQIRTSLEKQEVLGVQVAPEKKLSYQKETQYAMEELFKKILLIHLFSDNPEDPPSLVPTLISESGIKINQADEFGKTLLAQAVYNFVKPLEVLETILSIEGIDVNLCPTYVEEGKDYSAGSAVVNIAAKTPDIEAKILVRLLEAGADLSVTPLGDGRTASQILQNGRLPDFKVALTREMTTLPEATQKMLSADFALGSLEPADVPAYGSASGGAPDYASAVARAADDVIKLTGEHLSDSDDW